MIPRPFLIVRRSIKFYRKQAFYQVAIIALLSAVITGSLLTGRSVKSSLKRSASEHLGNACIIISSGHRYIDTSLVGNFRKISKTNCTGILAFSGYCQNLISQKGAYSTNIIGIDNDFFTFQGNEKLRLKPGEVALNRQLADFLEIKTGDEIILLFSQISEIPANAPFAPAKEPAKSIVMKAGPILEPAANGNFSLSISQITPMNIFINLADLSVNSDYPVKINRLLIENKPDLSPAVVYNDLKQVLKPNDIGLYLRFLKKTGEYELISDRIFIDETIVKDVENVLPSSAPVITYLGNRFTAGTRSTPYSFVSALPSAIYPEIGGDNEILINRWLADDLAARERDTLQMYWYSPDSLNNLVEKSDKFIISKIVDIKGIWSDSLLMPDFPGISGSKSCSGWDAGVPVKFDEIRRKDEDYWNKYKGTPKAFTNYEKGKELWGNNFGTATSIRFHSGISEKEITERLYGTLDPSKTGFTINNLFIESIKAADESVDFSTLFLSLGFFLILASIVLLSFAVTSSFNTKKDQINAFFALGFRNRWIENLLFFESGVIAFTGCLIGALAGYLVNILITIALNSVWRGAVQTNALTSIFNLMPVFTGFVITMITAMIFMLVKIKRYLKKLNRKEEKICVRPSPKRNLIFLLSSSFTALILLTASIFLNYQEIMLSFAAGTVLLAAMILFWRQHFVGYNITAPANMKKGKNLSRLYYSFYPSHAVTPVLFIAAGIFTVFITAANKMNFGSEHLKRSGGTGGYLLWCETAIPVREDLNSFAGRRSAGIDNDQLKGMKFVQAKRSDGDDASCLNLNHITAPPILGINPDEFINKKSFSFARSLTGENIENPWQFINFPAKNNIIYGIADQTVLDWGLKIKTGDTLMLRAENGQPLKIIISAGLKSSVFQGFVLIGMDNFIKYYPSVAGSSIMLVDGDKKSADLYKTTLAERFYNNGINITLTDDRLASFYEVTNTYLSVFGVFGALGMITGIAGLGFVLLRNYNLRRREFALMIATGFTIKRIRKIILSEQVLILFTGVSTGVISAIVATLPSVLKNADIPWIFLIMMVIAITITGLITLNLSVREVTNDSLTVSLKKE